MLCVFVVVTGKKNSSRFSLIGQRGSRGVHSSPSLTFRTSFLLHPSPTRRVGCVFLDTIPRLVGVCDSCLIWNESPCLGLWVHKIHNIATFGTFYFRFSFCLALLAGGL